MVSRRMKALFLLCMASYASAWSLFDNNKSRFKEESKYKEKSNYKASTSGNGFNPNMRGNASKNGGGGDMRNGNARGGKTGGNYRGDGFGPYGGQNNFSGPGQGSLGYNQGYPPVNGDASIAGGGMGPMGPGGGMQSQSMNMPEGGPMRYSEQTSMSGGSFSPDYSAHSGSGGGAPPGYQGSPYGQEGPDANMYPGGSQGMPMEGPGPSGDYPNAQMGGPSGPANPSPGSPGGFSEVVLNEKVDDLCDLAYDEVEMDHRKKISRMIDPVKRSSITRIGDPSDWAPKVKRVVRRQHPTKRCVYEIVAIPVGPDGMPWKSYNP